MSYLNYPYGQQPPLQQQQQNQNQQNQQYPLQSQPTGYPLQQQPQQYQQQQPQQQQLQQPYQQQIPQQQLQQNYGGLRPQLPLQNQPTGYLQPMNTGYNNSPQRTGYNSSLPPLQQQQQQQSAYPPSPSPLLSNPTGFIGGNSFGGGVQRQFISTFMPSNSIQPTPYMNPSEIQFAQQPLQGPTLQQSFINQNQQSNGSNSVPIPWALTADEKKRYDQIFRAWDQSGVGFIPGGMAKEVFGQAGLERDDLMAIWNLSDVEDRGKLNIDEFHVAMGLIYRRLNGNPIPTTLPPELAPPSARDLTDSVGFVTRLLKSDTNTRSTNNSSPDQQQSYAKSRSFNDSASGNAGGRKDATVYRHDDSSASTSTYKSSSRHLDRDTVRFGNEEDGGTNADLEEVKRGLSKGQALLNRAEERDQEEEELRDELRDIKRRIERVNDDLEYNLRSGRRTEAKDVEKRKLMRELSTLEHSELPELQKRMEEKEKQKRMDKKKLALERDSRNDKYDKYSDRPSTSSSSRRNYDDEDEKPRGYNRGTFDQEDNNDSGRRDYTRSSSSRTSSPPRSSRTPPPPPAPVASTKSIPPPAPSPPVSISSTPPPPPVVDTKSMNAVDRKAYIQAEAQRRIQLRLKALGVTSPSNDNSLDSTVSDRLESDRLEAQRKSELADADLKAKELARQSKLQQEKLRGVEIEQEISGKDLDKVDVVRKELEKSNLNDVAEKVAKGQLDEEEQGILEREATLKREKEVRMERLRKLEQELEEAKEAEENFIKNKAKFASSSSSSNKVPPPPPASRARANPPPPVVKKVDDDDNDFTPTPRQVPVPVAPAPPPPPPPVPSAPAIVSPTASKASSTNPFTRLTTTPAVTSPTSPVIPTPTAVKPNPFLPTAVPKVISRPPPTEDDWDSPAGLEKNRDSDDSSDEDENFGNRNNRQNLAQNLFSMMGLSGPSRTDTPTPPPPAPPAPPAPSAPPAPRAFQVSPPTDSGPILPPPSALLGQIQGGLRLKATKTKDRSTPASAGAVIGDASPPVQTYIPPVVREEPEEVVVEKKKEVVVEKVPEAEPEVLKTLPAVVAEPDPMDDINLSIHNRSRSLYAYEGQRSEDLSFEENLVIIVNPPKDSSSPWAFGTIEKSGKSGWIPKSYVEEFTVHKLKALYSYTAASEEEISFEENDSVSIVDSSDPNWFKAEQGGRIGLVPGTYFEDQQLTASTTSIPTAIAAVEYPASDDSSDDSSDDEEKGTPSPTRVVKNSEERELERLRVLEAAGLLVRNVNSPTSVQNGNSSEVSGKDNSPKRRATVRRRNAPARPIKVLYEQKEEKQVEQEERMEDAYDIYQRVMRDLPALPSTSTSTDVRSSLDLSSSARPTSPTPPSSISAQPRLSITENLFKRASDLVQRNSVSGSSTPSSKPIVSGPISLVGERSSFIQTLGSSWASLIDPSALENIPNEERKRQESIFELIGTESSYVQTLQLIIEVFFSALQPILAERAAEIIFANIEDILMFNTIFLSSLEDRQKSSRLYVDQVGDLILNNIKGLEIYRGYCVNLSNARNVLIDLKKGDEVRGVLDKLRVKNLELEHFLLEPMQRLTRYPLLISQILRYTPIDHVDHSSLTKSLKIVEQIVVTVNESVRIHDNEEKLIQLSDKLEFIDSGLADHRLDLTAKTLYLGPRTIIKEGILLKAKSGRKLNAYLFNDLLLLTEFKLSTKPSTGEGEREVVYRLPIPLEECSIKENSNDNTVFSIQFRGGSISLKCASSRSCKDWRSALNESRRLALEGIRNGRRGSFNR